VTEPTGSENRPQRPSPRAARRQPAPMPNRWPYFAGGAVAAVVVAITLLLWPGDAPPAPAAPSQPPAADPSKPAPVAPPPAPDRTPVAAPTGVEHDLFPASGLAGWTAEMGTWSNRNGVVSGRGEPNLNARLISKRPYRDFVLTCRLNMVGTGSAEIQVHDHDHVVAVAWEAPEVRQELRVEVRAGVVTATSDGKPLVVEDAPAKSGQGVLGFHVRRDGRLEISNARITELPAP
jgi:hypothetical protein